MHREPNKRSGGDGGMTVLFNAGRHWPAAPHHGRWTTRRLDGYVTA